MGAATFEPLGCLVTGAWLDGNLAEDASLGYFITGADNRPSGKMVDLDPDCQFASEIWGLRLRLSDPATGDLAFEGVFAPASFRDLYTRQLVDGGQENGQPAGGRFVSTLTDVRFGPAAERSAAIRALRDQSADSTLSVCLHQFGYYYGNTKPRYRTGRLIGSIGVKEPGEPMSVVVRRRIRPFAVQAGNPPSALVVVSAIDVELGPGGMGADLGHALILDDANGSLTDLGTALGLGRTVSIGIGLAPPAGVTPPLSDGLVTLFGEAEVMGAGWYERSGGIAEWPLDAVALASAKSAPLAAYLRTPRGLYPLGGETVEGLFVRADTFVRRLDHGESTTVAFKACRFGEPTAGVTILLGRPVSLSDRQTYADALRYPDRVVTDVNGEAEVLIASGAPYRRGAIDGMVFAISYVPLLVDGGQDPPGVGLDGLDQIFVHQREPFSGPAAPDWATDILPILRQYANLYPVMTHQLFDLADEMAVRMHARHMLLAMERPITDPNYMPVTRDLSGPRRDMIVDWLRRAAAEAGSQMALRRALPSTEARAMEDAPAQDSMELAAPDAKMVAAHLASGIAAREDV
jgi:hypothetical protein